jgi:hydroxyacylglutathione hydrolase
MRDINPYLQTAEAEGLRITHVTETHIHADFVSGIRDLSAATGATMFLSDMGDENWKYAFADTPKAVRVREGDSWMVGNIRLEVLHTPGHTPEHLSFLFTDTAGADRPMGVFTGDFVFVGDVGRPDLLEEAAGLVGTKEVGARAQFHSLQRFKQLPDYLQILPAHGAGSACGKALGAVPSTTVGYEKLFNPAFQFTDETAFVDWLLAGQPEAPRYFAQMKKVNKLGSPLVADLPAPRRGDATQLRQAVGQGALVIDARAREDYAASYVAGTLNIPMTSTAFSTFVGWFVRYDAPTYLILPDEAALNRALLELRAIGVDDIPAYFLPADLGQGERLPTIGSAELAERLPKNGLVILDVRGKSEYAEKHIQGAQNAFVGHLPRLLDSLPRDRTIVTQCATGYRSQIAASYLRGQGFREVLALNDPLEVWSKALPTE